MNTFGSNQPKANKSGPQAHAASPFAHALAETEKASFETNANSDFSRALATAQKSSGSTTNSQENEQEAGDNNLPALSNYWQEKQQQEIKEKQKKEALRKKLHDKVNPVETTELFSAREKKVQQEIDAIRKELQLLSKDIADLNKSVELTLMGPVVNPGTEGKYYLSFFAQLRSFIMLLRQKVRSANTWATQLNKKKKKKRGSAFMMEGKKGAEAGKTVFDMMHHEVATARSVG